MSLSDAEKKKLIGRIEVHTSAKWLFNYFLKNVFMKCDEREKNYNLLIGSFNPTGKQQQQQKKDFSTWILETSENVYLFVTLSCLVSFVVCIYMGIAKLCTQLHPAHFSLHPTRGNSLNIIWTKISNVIGQFPQIQAEKFKVLRFDWKLAHMISWRCWFRVQN